VVIQKIDVFNVRAFKPENDPPVGPDNDTPKSGIVALELVQPETWQVHILGLCRALQTGQHARDLLDMVRA
jgi:hypothetical protein